MRSALTWRWSASSAEFSQEGLPVVFVEAAPAEEIGFLTYAEKGREIRELVTEMLGGVTPEGVAANADRKSGTTLYVKDCNARI